MITDKKTVKKIVKLAIVLARLNNTDIYIMHYLINKIIIKRDLSNINIDDISKSIDNIVK